MSVLRSTKNCCNKTTLHYIEFNVLKGCYLFVYELFGNLF